MPSAGHRGEHDDRWNVLGELAQRHQQQFRVRISPLSLALLTNHQAQQTTACEHRIINCRCNRQQAIVDRKASTHGHPFQRSPVKVAEYKTTNAEIIVLSQGTGAIRSRTTQARDAIRPRGEVRRWQGL